MIRGVFRIVKDTQLRGLQALAKRVQQGTQQVHVGVPEGLREADGTSLALVATVNEFGSADGTIPERSYIRAALRSRTNQAYFKQVNAANLLRVIRGTLTMSAALGQLGAVAAARVKAKMRSGPFAPNAPATIRAKGEGKPPLFDSATLYQAITWIVMPLSRKLLSAAGGRA